MGAGPHTLERVRSWRNYFTYVGGDTWFFYIDPVSYATVGCRFFHDPSKNDGEYLVFDGLVNGANELRLPGNRRWHMNLDGEQIAIDEILSVD